MKIRYWAWRLVVWAMGIHHMQWMDLTSDWLQNHFNDAESDKYFQTLKKWGWDWVE